LGVGGCRLWYVTASARKAAAAGAAETLNSGVVGGSVPVEIGYMNVIPKCLDSSAKYPVYENLPETYAAINSYLADNPLEGLFRLLLVRCSTIRFYRAMHYSAKHGLAIACRLSVRLSVCDVGGS